MKRIIMSACMATALYQSAAQQKQEPADSFYTLTPVEVKAIRAGENAPFSKTNLLRKDIQPQNLGQDIPFLLNQTPSVVVNADAGNAVGYTGIRIRGTDATRINMTINGIPYNDAESQGLFFVNLPDLSSSAGSVQIQRGVGTSSNGAGAFGATLNFSTNELNATPYLELNNSAGSFSTFKNTLKYGSGLYNGFTTDIRLSQISSNGFIDRAASRLKSAYFSTAWMDHNSSLRLNVFTGHEKTYQAWYGISEADLLAGNRKVNYAGSEKPGSPYENETDNYTQTHYQLFFNQAINARINLNLASFLTRGNGFYEQYKAGEDYATYNMSYPVNGSDTLFETDLTRRLWLDNYYYGFVYGLHYKTDKHQATLGGGLTKYDGRHYGKVLWASNGLTATDSWYNLDAYKTDVNLYVKHQAVISDGLFLFYDLQYRFVDYTLNGFRNNPGLRLKNNWHFFNPKTGITWRKNNWKSYFSVSLAAKEPNRDDFEAGVAQQPRPEKLRDIEAGVEQTGKKAAWSATVFYMHYRDQLVLTGKINDVGAYTRTNIPKSYRTGIEMQASYQPINWFKASGNLTLSRNRLLDLTEYIDDYDNGGQKTNTYAAADIAFSPAITGAATLEFGPFSGTGISLISKYVSRQYLDNTSNNSRSLDPFYVQDIRITHRLQFRKVRELTLTGQVNNLLNAAYEPNGYTFSYIYGGRQTTENYYFPMAGINYMIGLNLRF